MMDALARLEIESECAKLAHLFAKYADNGDHAALAGLFVEDCELARPFQPDHPYYGRDRVQAIFRDRPPMLVRHLVTNLLVEVVSESAATGSSYLTMLSSHKLDSLPQEAGGIFVGAFEDVFVKTAQGWKFKSRHGNVALYQGGTPPNLPPPSDEARGLT